MPKHTVGMFIEERPGMVPETLAAELVFIVAGHRFPTGIRADTPDACVQAFIRRLSVAGHGRKKTSDRSPYDAGRRWPR